MKNLASILIIGVLVAGCGEARLDQPGLHSGSLGGSKYAIAAPKEWNGDLLMLAHGLRSEEESLVAEVDVEEPLYRGLLADGWLIASTSYRRNGPIIRDAGDDIDALRRHVQRIYGPAKRTFLLGWSMGGAICTMLAETRRDDYDGAVAVGAALQVHDRENPYRLNYRPQIPLLFLTNRSELSGPTIYVRHASKAASPPALWIVKRDGHVNVNDPEQRAALDAIVGYAETGKIARKKDGTVPMGNQPSVAHFRDGKAHANVTGTSESFGNIYSQFVQHDLTALGIAEGSDFTVGMGDASFNIRLAKTYSDVPRGEWVAFIRADGKLQVARNYANASETLGCKAGDEIYIAPLPAK